MKSLECALVLVAIVALSGAPTSAQMVRWVDDQGRVHYSEGIESVPPQYRDRVQQKEMIKHPQSYYDRIEREQRTEERQRTRQELRERVEQACRTEELRILVAGGERSPECDELRRQRMRNVIR